MRANPKLPDLRQPRRAIAHRMQRKACALGWVAAAMLGLAGGPGLAQQPPVFRARSDIVLVPVTVLDHHNRPVSGLAATQFELLVDKQRVPVIAFDTVPGTEARNQPGAAALEPGSYRNVSGVAASDQNLVILLIDYVNTTLPERANLRRDLLRFFSNEFKPGQQFAMYGMARSLVLLQPFSARPEPLIEAARRLLHERAEPEVAGFVPVLPAQVANVAPLPMNYDRLETVAATASPLAHKAGVDTAASTASERTLLDAGFKYFFIRGMRQQADVTQAARVELTLSQFRQLARAFAAVPGKKTVVWLTGDASALNPVGLYSGNFDDPMAESAHERWAAIAAAYEELGGAGISLFPVDVRGLQGSGLIDDGRAAARDTFGDLAGDTMSHSAEATAEQVRLGDATRTLFAMETAAAETGGMTLKNDNDVAGLLRRAQQLWSHYYVLSFRPAITAKPAYHSIAVRVSAPGAHVLARRGFTTRPISMRGDDEEIRRDIADAAQSPVDLTSLPLTLTPGKPQHASEGSELPFTLRIPLEALSGEELPKGERYDLTCVTLVRDRLGRAVESTSQRFDRTIAPAESAEIKKSDLLYRGSFRAAQKGIYFGRVIVRDNLGGRTATLTLRLGWE